jgi:hypothetical protein
MFPFNRKSAAQAKEASSQTKYEYEDAVRRCYEWKAVTLALCGFQKFRAFNFVESSLQSERKPFVEDDYRFWGVVHEGDQFSKHVRCEVQIQPEADPGAAVGKYIGWFVLTHISMLRDKTLREEQTLLLNVTLRDPTSMLKTSLIDGLRDAALSGFRSISLSRWDRFMKCSVPEDRVRVA